jgi:hypothetical protein
VPHADTGGPRAHGQAVEAGNLPRWAPRPMPDPARRAVHTMLWFPRGPHALGRPRRRERAHPNAMTPPRLPRARHTHRHARRVAVLALHLLPPHAALAHLHLRRATPPVAVVTYSLSRLSEQLSPIPTVRLTQDRTTDAATIGSVLTNSDLIIYPEGTTCRESFLLRFSKLSANSTTTSCRWPWSVG